MNKKTIINDSIAEINKTRFENELVAEQNYKFARQKSKEFLKLDSEYRKTLLEIGQGQIDEKVAKQKLYELKTQKELALKKIGMSEKDITPKIDCKLCKDTGFVDNKRCVCLNKKIHKKLLDNSGLKTENLHSFEESDQNILADNEFLEKAYELAKKYVNKFPDVKTPNLIFMGEVGVGKTFLLECIADALIKKEFFVVYATAFNLSNTMLKAMKSSPFDSEIIMSPLLECDLLLIDDLGSEPMFRNVSVTNLFSILNERELKNKPTLISTNLDALKIEERYGNRLFSRMMNKRNTKILQFVGKDLRINKKTY